MMRSPFKSCGRLLTATALILGTVIAAPTPQANVPTHPQEQATLPPVESGPLSYRGAWGGLHVADVTLTLRGDSQVYQGDMDIATRGVVGWAFEWMGVLHSRGERDALGLRPAFFERRFTQSDEVGSVEVRYGADGVALGLEDGEPHTDIPADLRRNTVDPLAALIALRQQVRAGRQGMVSVPVFDGKRRLDLIADISAPRSATAASRTAHDVVTVHADITPIAGFSKRQEKGWSSSTIQMQFTADDRAIPVRIVIHSPAGAAVLTLR